MKDEMFRNERLFEGGRIDSMGIFLFGCCLTMDYAHSPDCWLGDGGIKEQTEISSSSSFIVVVGETEIENGAFGIELN